MSSGKKYVDKYENEALGRARAVREKLRSDSGREYRWSLDSIHKVLIGLKPKYLCHVDADFGLDLVKIKGEVWNCELYGIVNSPVYSRLSPQIFRHCNLIEFTITDAKHYGQDTYETVFVTHKPVNWQTMESLVALSTKYVVMHEQNIKFDIKRCPYRWDHKDGVYVFYK